MHPTRVLLDQRTLTEEGIWLQLGYNARCGYRRERAEGLEKSGAGKGTRTPDPLLGKQMLYQLSYSRSPQPTVKHYYTEHYSSWGGFAQGHPGDGAG